MSSKSKQISLIQAFKGGQKRKHVLFASKPSAGFPAPGDDLIEDALDINDFLIEHPDATFFVRVAGDSMEGAKIFADDILVVDRSLNPRSGSIVVAAVYGEMVVKRLKCGESGAWLLSESEYYEPIAITDNEDCFVWGVVIGSVRVFK